MSVTVVLRLIAYINTLSSLWRVLGKGKVDNHDTAAMSPAAGELDVFLSPVASESKTAIDTSTGPER